MLRVLIRVALIPTVLVLTGVIGILAFTSSASAAINPQINFQGKLANPDGTNVTNGNYSIVFSMYTVDTGGVAIWTETQNVSITDGIFQVYLGSTTSLPGSVDFNSSSIYLGIKVGADPEMSPRVRFTSSPYAFNSDKLNGLDSAGFVQLAQGVQSDSSTTNASIAINKTGTTAKIVDIQRGGSAVFNINNDGSVLFKNQADSAVAFDVQDSLGVSLLTVDTLNDRLYVGDSTPDAVGALLVLDNKNTAGDPAGIGVLGGMYYNSNENLYRCYRSVNSTAADGAWEDCSTQPIDRSFTQEDEFFSGGTASGTIGKMGWFTSTIGGAPTYTYNNATPAPSADRPGILRLRTPGTANQGGTLSLGTGSMAIGAEQVVKTAIATAATGVGTQAVRVGVHNETTTTARPTTGVWWEYDPAVNANWQYCYYNATVAVCAPSVMAPVANTFRTLEIRITAIGTGTSSAEYFIDGTKYTVSGITINTTNRVAPAMTCYAVVNNTARDCFIDYYQIRGGSGTYR